MKPHYSVVLASDLNEGGYAVTEPALPGCSRQGETVEEALAQVQEAVRVHVRTVVRHGEPIPAEGVGPLVSQVEAEIEVGEPALA